MKGNAATSSNGESPSANRESTESAGNSIVRNIFSIRGTVAWREWLERFAVHQRVTPTALIDRALTEAARRAGFDKPPPRH